jgi:hypothetical protein
MLNVLAFVGATFVGLVLLIVSGPPLWLFSPLVTTITTLIAPYSAAAGTPPQRRCSCRARGGADREPGRHCSAATANA